MHRLLRQSCSHNCDPSHSLQKLSWRFWGQMPDPRQSLHWLLRRSCSHICEGIKGVRAGRRVEYMEKDSPKRGRMSNLTAIAISEDSPQEDYRADQSTPKQRATTQRRHSARQQQQLGEGSVSSAVSSDMRRLEFDAYLLRHRILKMKSDAQRNASSAASGPPPSPRDGSGAQIP